MAILVIVLVFIKPSVFIFPALLKARVAIYRNLQAMPIILIIKATNEDYSWQWSIIVGNSWSIIPNGIIDF